MAKEPKLNKSIKNAVTLTIDVQVNGTKVVINSNLKHKVPKQTAIDLIAMFTERNIKKADA